MGLHFSGNFRKEPLAVGRPIPFELHAHRVVARSGRGAYQACESQVAIRMPQPGEFQRMADFRPLIIEIVLSDGWRDTSW